MLPKKALPNWQQYTPDVAELLQVRSQNGRTAARVQIVQAPLTAEVDAPTKTDLVDMQGTELATGKQESMSVLAGIEVNFRALEGDYAWIGRNPLA